MLLSNCITEYYKAIGDGTATIYTRETIETQFYKEMKSKRNGKDGRLGQQKWTKLAHKISPYS